MANILKEPTYQDCAARYSNWEFLLKEALKDMFASLPSFGSSTYEVRNDKIVYVYGESFVDNVIMGYDTIWAYFQEYSNGRISEDSVKRSVGIIVNCGTFSYAEIPHDFFYITGVSGTLQTLADPEKKILDDVYGIKKMTFLSSVFGDCIRDFDTNPESYLKVLWNEEDYYLQIRDEIDRMRKAKCAVLVFFESLSKLDHFYNSDIFTDLKNIPDTQIISEKVSTADRDLFIKRAASEQKVTLLTRTFGRGTDFECFDPKVLAAGGIHVVQCFFSDEISEECQIKGRCARQGDPGSFKIVLLSNSLDKVLGSTWETILKTPGIHLYQTLCNARIKNYETTCASRYVSIEQCKKDHEASIEFMKAIINGDISLIKKFVSDTNKGSYTEANVSRTVLLMDATGSMGSLLGAVKDTVCKMFELASAVLKEKGFPEDNFKMQFVVYRDYDCQERILQCSSWETKALNLRAFMEKVGPEGGGDYEEAIEIGFWHVLQQAEQDEGVSQVLLIADAPAKLLPAIKSYRNKYVGEATWAKKYGPPTEFTTQLPIFKEKGLPIHTFYLEKGAQPNFDAIAKATGGTSRYLDIRDKNGAKNLTAFVTEEVLRKSGGDQGEALVALFRSKYAVSFLS